MKLHEKIKEKLSFIENMYDNIKIIDPINKKAIIIKDKNKENNGTSYDCWEKDVSYTKCTSMKAYLEKDSFYKIEFSGNKVALVMAAPVFIDGAVYILEMIKDISKNGRIFDINTNSDLTITTLINKMNKKIIIDELTGVYNRRFINEKLPIDLNNNILHGSPLSLIMADINKFKLVNDKYGHVIGDKVLKDFAKILTNSIRKNSDWVARYGGDEFLIVLNNTNEENAIKISGKIEKVLEAAPFRYNSISTKITSSFGIYCTRNEKTDVEAILARVDNKLYEAKSKKNSNISTENMKVKKNKLSILNGKIEELRDILNEMCITSEELAADKQRLNISKRLDELIVEYLKNI